MFARLHAVFDGGAREARVVVVVTVLLVLLRAAAFTLSEHVSFDSDQAIVGLMAKHLSELRTFPLFFYGQNYMLGVQSWIIAPFFLVARPSVTVMRLPLVLLNIAAALILIRAIRSSVGLRPALAFVAVLPFIMPTPVVAGSFLEALGSSGVEPLLYIVFLWMLRQRPFAFGALLAFGFLHREFTIYAVPALLMVSADRSFLTAGAARWAGWMAAGFGLVWLVIADLRMHLSGVSLVLQAQMVGRHACFEMAQLPGRMIYAVQSALPALSGGITMPLSEYGFRSSAVTGSALIGLLLAAGIPVMLGRIAWLWARRGGTERDVRFGVYLAVVGGITLAAYSLACSVAFNAHPTIRYVNLALLLPIGCCAIFLAWETSARLKSLIVAMFLVWGAANLVDNVRVMHAAYFRPLPSPHRELTDFLLSHQIRYGRADYWDAYVVDFLSRERVTVGSFGKLRIPEYERRVDENADTAVHIRRKPCEGWKEVAAWCIQLPAR